MLTKITPTDICINFEVVKFFGEEEKLLVMLPDTVSPDVIPFLGFFNSDIDGVLYFKSNPICPDCGLELVESTVEEFYPNKLDNVYRIVYRCPDKECGKKHRAKLDKFIDNGSNYTNNMKQLGSRLQFIEKIAYRKMSEIFQAILGIRIPKSTMYNHQDQTSDEILTAVEKEIDAEVERQEIEASGNYNYDEQFMKVSKNKKAKLQLLDANTKYAYPAMILNQDKFDSDTILNYWNTILSNLPKECMITDGHTMYPSICKEFEIEQALCTFHAIHNVRDKPYKIINRNNTKRKNKSKKIKTIEENLTELNNQYIPKRGRFRKNDTKQRKLYEKIQSKNRQISTLNQEIRTLNKEDKELNKYMDKISSIFKSKTLKTAKNRLNRLKEEKNKLPDSIGDALDKIDKKFDKLTKHIGNDDIPSTNNLVELFFNVTCGNKLKKHYRTNKGVDRKMRANRSRWNYRVCLGKTDYILPVFVIQPTEKILNL